MSQAEFKPVGQSASRLFGPRKLLVCGYTPEKQNMLRAVLDVVPQANDLPLIFATQDDMDSTLETLFADSHAAGHGEPAPGPAVIIMAGITEQELHRIMAEHKKTSLAPPIWATLTPTSATWKLSDLLRELGREKEAMKQHQQER